MTLFTGLDPSSNISQLTAAPVVVEPEVLPESHPFDDDVKMSQEEIDRANALSCIISTVTDAYQSAKDARTTQEAIWLNNFLQWRGEYTPEEMAGIREAKLRNGNASEAFIKITKTKVTAALGQIQEILFPQDRFPLGIEATPEPEGIAKEVFLVPEAMPSVYGYEGDGEEIEPGATTQTLLGGLYSKYRNLIAGKKAVEGPSPDPKQFIQLSPADEAASLMQRIILDQMYEGNVQREIRRAAWECAVLGTGIIKGPLTMSETVHSWKKEGDAIVYTPTIKDSPDSKYVSCWDFYPDPNATCVQDAAFTIEKHKFNRPEITKLKSYKGFDRNAIDRVLRTPPKRDQEVWETQIREVDTTLSDDRYEVLEYWGYLEAKHLEYLDSIEKEELATLVDQAQVNVWICNGELLRVIINPFVPARIPYYAVPFEEANYQIWGISIPENMRDPQMLMNGHTRMAIDNLRLAGNVILEVNENQLVPGQDLTLHPGKVFRKQGGAPGQSIYGITIPNTAPQHLQMFDKARQLADEASGQPSYSYGQTGVSGTNRTALGMSMLMSAASGNIKQVVKNFDEYMIKPLGEAYFAWNMQFNPKADIRGDLRIVPKGTSSIMQKEVHSQRLLQFLQVVSSNQLLTPFANLDYLLREIAKALDLDPEKAVNDPKMAQLVAQIMGAMNAQGQEPGQPGSPEGMGTPNPMDNSGSGNGNPGVGIPQQPTEPGFSGNPQA